MKAVTITLYKSELIYEIQNKTFLTGRSRESGDNHEQVANMQANEEDEHLNQLLRSIGNAIDALKSKLSNFISGTGTTANNVQITEEGNLEVALDMPDNFNVAVLDAVKTAINEYILNTSIFEWFTITKPDEAKVYFDKSVNNLAELREALNKRTRPERTIPAP
ncbi:hypothetical protein [uncultured Bacteroides sp.]|uniref:hypothetical protein n=1 Tax=uncultured Bacteroides sp. TaxID=162156 RepID=UPI002AA74729|nr:hypothetical protein [uncultured Bacteroides sp.]